jgi:transcriptional regulator GlxA family with amidase domain
MTASLGALMTNLITHSVTPSTGERRSLSDLPRHIGLLISQDCSMAIVGVVADALRLANEFTRANIRSTPYELSLLSCAGGTIDISFDLSIRTKTLDQYELSEFHALFVVTPDDKTKPDARDFASWLSRQHNFASAFSESPVYSGNAFRTRVPVLMLEERFDGLGAVRNAPLDIVLAQIESDLGGETSRKISRALNPPAVQRVRAEAGDLSMTTRQKVCDSARWMRDNFSGPISVAHAAEYAAMSKRNYQRRFKAEFGITPLEYLLRARFEAVCLMLEDTDLPIDKIARWCGMGDGNRLGRIFKERIGISPTQYRSKKQMEKERYGVTPAIVHDLPKAVAQATSMHDDD